MPVETAMIGPLARWGHRAYQWRRKVRLTVHRATVEGPFMSFGDGPVINVPSDYYFVTVTNASPRRDIVVTHVWLDTSPPVHIPDPDLPKRLPYSQPWETAVPVTDIPRGNTGVEWLARCQLAPDDKIIKSVPRKNVPPFGVVPR